MLGLMLIAGAAVAADEPTFRPQGVWMSADGEGGIAIEDCGGRLCGRIVWMKQPTQPDGSPKRDAGNPDPAHRDRPVCGLQIIDDLTPKSPNHWTGGRVYDPDSGRTYRATLTMEGPSALRLRGYIGVPLLGQTQIWHLAPADLPPCAP